MKKSNYMTQSPVAIDDCGMASLALTLGDKWSLLIIRQVFYRVSRFQDICRELGIPRAVLTSRLKKLVALGILKKVAYQSEGERKRFAYELDAAGVALLPLLVQAMDWGDTYIRKQSSAVEVIDAETGAQLKLGFVDKDTKTVGIENLRFKLAPKT